MTGHLWSLGHMKHIEGMNMYVSRISTKYLSKYTKPLMLPSFRLAFALLLQAKIMEIHIPCQWT
jgi:hypothetical protein